jgi:hypothetical protein
MHFKIPSIKLLVSMGMFEHQGFAADEVLQAMMRASRNGCWSLPSASQLVL